MGIKRLFFIPVFALIFGAFGAINPARAVKVCFSLEDIGYNANANGTTVIGSTFSLNDVGGGGVTISGTGICSTTSHSGPASDITIPDPTAGAYCWCHIDRINDGNDVIFNSLVYAVALEEYHNTSDCERTCASACASEFERDTNSVRRVFYNNPLGRFCTAGCSTMQDIAEINIDGGYTDGSEWVWALVNGGEVFGDPLCSVDSANAGDSGVPDTTTSGGSNCWCRATRFYDGDGVLHSATSSTWFSTGTRFEDSSQCQLKCAETCATDSTVQNSMITSGDFCTSAPYGGYFVTYDCGDGSGSPADSNNPYAPGATVTTLAANSCTPPNGERFRNWKCSNGAVGAAGGSFTINEDVTCTAQYGQYDVTYDCGVGSGTAPVDTDNPYLSGETVTLAQNTCTPSANQSFSKWNCGGRLYNAGATLTINSNTSCSARYYPFSVTVARTSSFRFKLSAQGTFYVDCGSGTLSGNGVSGDTITKNNTNTETYTCTWNKATTATLLIGGLATTYNTAESSAAISFSDDTKIVRISGDLSAIFPRYGSNAGQYPVFYETFKGCTGIDKLPDTLFQNYTAGGAGMFAGTFRGCTGLTGLPNGLFTNITSAATSMFHTCHTFPRVTFESFTRCKSFYGLYI